MKEEILYVQSNSGTTVLIRDEKLAVKAAQSNGTVCERECFADYEGRPAKPVYFWKGGFGHWVGINPETAIVDNGACLRDLLTRLRGNEPVYVPKMIREQEMHDQAKQLVYNWAMVTGRTGKQHAQTRRGKIQKLMKNGMTSEYALRLMREAGIRE
jgi:hypothetical protein